MNQVVLNEPLSQISLLFVSGAMAFIAVAPKQQHLGLGHYLIHAVDSIVDKDQQSAGIGVFVTLDKYKAFFADDQYQKVAELSFSTVQGSLMFRVRQTA